MEACGEDQLSVDRWCGPDFLRRRDCGGHAVPKAASDHCGHDHRLEPLYYVACLCRVADLDNHLLAERGERGLNLHRLCGVCGIEHAADHSLMDTEAAG